MKKLLPLFSLFIFHFSFIKGQDTISLNNGQKIVGKVSRINDDVHYKLASDSNKKLKILLTKVQSIRYSDGTIFTANPEMDSIQNAKRVPICYFTINAGLTLPTGQYGSSNFELVNPISDELPPIYAGFAGVGYTFGISTDLNIYRGWGISVSGGYLHQPFDANGFLSENFPNTDNVATGTYFYNHYYLLTGILKAWGSSKFQFTVRFLMGELFFNVPPTEGTMTALGSNGAPSGPTFNFNINGEHVQGFAADFGVGCRAIAAGKICIFENFDFIPVHKIAFDMTAHVSNSTYSGNNNLETTTSVGMINFTGGIGYILL